MYYDLKTMNREILDRYQGCLLGGAVGDALGYPVEFLREASIWSMYGSKGIQTLEQAGDPARISDDTQMSLFAVNVILYAAEQKKPMNESLWLAYREWLGTQGNTGRMDDPSAPKMKLYCEPRLHAVRAPGTTCLSAIRTSANGGTVQQPVNNSKGCGTVMRAAPFGLAAPIVDSQENGLIVADELAVCDAALTHGHELAWISSGLLAQIVYYVVHRCPDRKDRLEAVLPHLNFRGNTAARDLLERAVTLANDPSVSDLDGIHSLGEGWVAEEALAIAVFCAVRYQNDFSAAIRAAVNHNGDSDSTGAICGNILGAWLGREAVAQAFDLRHLELCDRIEDMAEKLFHCACGVR